ncbi:MAG: hypothetical protein KA198_02540 [Chitinophagaceae bacterium]|nr:hypothetical protein [Chitinophagaceae bacterium]
MKRILTKCKNFYCLMLFIFLSAFTARPYSQLMIGGWKSIDSNEIFLEQENVEIQRLTFSIDEFTVRLALKNRSGRETPFNLAYKYVDYYKEQPSPILVLKSTCDQEFLLVFSVEQLSKEFLSLKFDKELSSKLIQAESPVFNFKRIAGPPENMD